MHRSNSLQSASWQFNGKLTAAIAGTAFLSLAMFSFASDPPDKPPLDARGSPWGISSSASSFRNHTEWFPKMSAAGVTTVRLFPEWRGLEPAQGTWKWEQTDAFVKAAADNHIEINAILMGSTPWTKAKLHAFPMDHLDDWSTYVSTVVDRYKDRVHYWEVWNEGNGGFNDDHHTTLDYAKLAVATYTTAKKADPKAQVGLTVASFDAPYLNQAIRAMAKEGKPNRFDYLCIHPYEIADGLGDADGEVPYLWMTHGLRDMLKTSAPERADAEIWITEVGRRIEARKGHGATEEGAARALVKLYTMAVAQGVRRTQWFEAQDPAGEDQGFGLLNRDGRPRASYHALKTMTKRLGATPKYQGWLALGSGGKGYGFVFQSEATPVLVAWMPAGATDKTTTFKNDVEVVDVLGKTTATLKAGQPLPLTDAPVFLIGVLDDLLAQAQANAKKNFPWGGDYSTAEKVSVELGSADGSHGVSQVGRQSTPTCTFPDGSTGIILRGNQGANFYVHPSFASFSTQEYYIRVTVRRLDAGNVGMNLNYEIADSQGRSPYKNRGEWFGLTKDDGWQTHSWHVTDACFSKMWGYDFSFRPEQSIPFVIGKVEVSKVPFK